MIMCLKLLFPNKVFHLMLLVPTKTYSLSKKVKTWGVLQQIVLGLDPNCHLLAE